MSHFHSPSRRQLVVLGVAAAFGGLSGIATAQNVADIRKKGELTVGMLVDFPPYGTTNAQNQPDGYDADVARLLAKDLGVKLNIVPVTGPNRIPFLLTNKVDLLVASLAITPERAKQVDFSAPYATASVILYGARKVDIKTAADLKGKRIGVARASVQDVALTSMSPEGTEIRRFDDDASGMQALISGQVDAIGCSTTVAAQIAKRVPADTYEKKLTIREQVMAIAFRPGQVELKKTLDEFIARNRANGELNKLYQKWLGVDFPVVTGA